ncbi:hypothetical protein KTQ42_20965 [Noviherbaspirillum sp. L7-7A]|uniref:hypothetical protein n=1 Tax=Noviherbaspirillum sp. L7-7A TaxID=2850560 RepID=UPI001C2BA170|nr:hypothetical protein [Noviherbaspirillum sp. L7-7A]MBV0881758.1 hypothetical protein [Noviherbaspirillum sp. L7-7A]
MHLTPHFIAMILAHNNGSLKGSNAKTLRMHLMDALGLPGALKRVLALREVLNGGPIIN